MFVSGLGFKFLIGNLYLQTTSLTNLSAVTLTYLENPFPAGSSRVPFDTKSDSDILCLLAGLPIFTTGTGKGVFLNKKN